MSRVRIQAFLVKVREVRGYSRCGRTVGGDAAQGNGMTVFLRLRISIPFHAERIKASRRCGNC